MCPNVVSRAEPRPKAVDVWKGKADIGLPEKEGIQTLMAQGRSTRIISMIRWIRSQ